MVSAEVLGYVLLSVSWLGFGVIHSALAALSVKAWVSVRWPRLVPGYRLAYNLLAVALLAGPLWLMHRLQGPKLWQWQGVAGWTADALALVALGLFVLSLRYYHGGEFLGTSQLRRGAGDPDSGETFQVSPLHRFVRHPWYTLALVLIWTRSLDLAQLISAAMATLYFFVGSRLEERKLCARFGAVYQSYQRQVPALLPNPWRYLDRTATRSLLDAADRASRQG